jgi:hypothetical protein
MLFTVYTKQRAVIFKHTSVREYVAIEDIPLKSYGLSQGSVKRRRVGCRIAGRITTQQK